MSLPRFAFMCFFFFTWMMTSEENVSSAENRFVYLENHIQLFPLCKVHVCCVPTQVETAFLHFFFVLCHFLSSSFFLKVFIQKLLLTGCYKAMNVAKNYYYSICQNITGPCECLIQTVQRSTSEFIDESVLFTYPCYKDIGTLNLNKRKKILSIHTQMLGWD